MYGSQARHEARNDGDIDLLVLLDGPVDYSRDLRTNIDALYDLVLALERPISAMPVDVAAYEAAVYPLYRSAKAPIRGPSGSGNENVTRTMSPKLP